MTNGSGRLGDVAEIVEAITRWAYAVDFGEFAALRDVFADDARVDFVMAALGRENIAVTGADAVIERISSRGPMPMVPRHAMTNHLVTVDDDTARSTSYLATGTGLYTCAHARTPSGWRITAMEVRAF
jgi:SnoaL-like domain